MEANTITISTDNFSVTEMNNIINQIQSSLRTEATDGSYEEEPAQAIENINPFIKPFGRSYIFNLIQLLFLRFLKTI